MSDSIDERTERITEVRAFYMAAPFMVPLLIKRKDMVFKQLMAAQRDSQTEKFTNLVAQLYALDALEMEIKQKDNEYRQLEETANGSTKRN